MKQLTRLIVIFLCAVLLPACAAVPSAADAAPVLPANLPVSTAVILPTATALPTAAPAETAIPTPLPSTDVQEPLAVVDAFYQWYGEQPMGEVLTERTYADSPYLTGIFKSDLGYLLDSFKDQAGYDPFICAQALLPSLVFDPVYLSGEEARAIGQVVIEGQVRHYFVVSLDKSEGDWKIGSIACPFDSKTAVSALYTWYLGYINNGANALQRGENFRNPRSDGVITGFFLFSDEYRQKLAGELDQMGDDGAYDPILLAQDIPNSFWVDPAQDGDDIQVRLTFGPQSSRYVFVHLVKDVDFYWRVNGIEAVEEPVFDLEAHADVDTSGWQEYVNLKYGFSFRYPSSWKVKSPDLSGIPSDDALKASAHFFPGWSDQTVLGLWVDVLVGSEQQVVNYFVTEQHRQVTINDQRVWMDRETCNTRFVFRHPKLENTWVIIGDGCPSMPGRERYTEELEPVFAPLLRSVNFR